MTSNREESNTIIEKNEEFEEINKIEGIGEIVDDIIEQAPDCDVNILPGENTPGDQHTQPLPLNVSPKKIYDKKGRPFDIGLHKTDENGLPLLNQDGTAKLRSRKQREQYEKENPAPPDESKNIGMEQAGQMFATYTFAFCSGVFGQEFKPVKNADIDENKLMADAYTQYLIAKDVEELPPGMILIGAISLYLIPRFMEQKVQEKITTKIKRIYKKIFRK